EFCTISFHDTSTPEISTLSLHDALPISEAESHEQRRCQNLPARPPGPHLRGTRRRGRRRRFPRGQLDPGRGRRRSLPGAHRRRRSEEHTSELQSRENLVCRLLLEKKKRR